MARADGRGTAFYKEEMGSVEAGAGCHGRLCFTQSWVTMHTLGHQIYIYFLLILQQMAVKCLKDQKVPRLQTSITWAGGELAEARCMWARAGAGGGGVTKAKGTCRR